MVGNTQAMKATCHVLTVLGLAGLMWPTTFLAQHESQSPVHSSNADNTAESDSVWVFRDGVFQQRSTNNNVPEFDPHFARFDRDASGYHQRELPKPPDSFRYGWSGDVMLLRALDRFGKTWKLRLGCELTIEDNYPYGNIDGSHLLALDNAIEALNQSEPAANEGFPEAAGVLRRLFPDWKVSMNDTKPPIVFIENTKLKQPVLHRPVNLEAYAGGLAGLLSILRKGGIFLSRPWEGTDYIASFSDDTYYNRVIRIPAMQSTVGHCFAAALLDEKLNYGICFCLVSSRTGVRWIESGSQQKKEPLEAVLYVQRLSDTNPPALRRSAK